MNTSLTQLHYLLRELHVVYQNNTERKESEEKFNVFTTILKYNDERYLHSRFISSILDPQSPHRLKDTPLKLLLCILNSQFAYSIDTLEIFPSTRSWSEHNNIDIFLIDRQYRNAIIIENKIYAKDSNHEEDGQIERYYKKTIEEDHVPAEKIEVYYLTTDRHSPSDDSVSLTQCYPELKEKVQCIDYGNEILRWMSLLVKESVNQPFLRETINQYIRLINEMTNNTDIQERLEIIDTISKNDEMLNSAKYLIDNFKHVRWHTIYEFFQELASALKARNYTIRETPSTNIIDDIVHGGPNKSRWQYPTIVFGKEGFVFEIQAEYCSGLYFGMTYRNNLQKRITDIERFVKQSEEFNESYNEDWIFWKSFNVSDDDQIDLWNFEWKGTFNLISRAKRHESIQKHLDAFEEQINELFRKCHLPSPTQ